jgi:hypothetical protein
MNRAAFAIEHGNLRLEFLRQRRTRYPLPLGFGPRHPRFDTLADQRPLKLGERRHHRKN